jgi:hypothetical protein
LEIRRVGKGKGAISVLKRAKHAKELEGSIKRIFQIQKEVEEDHDRIFFFGLDKS